MEQFKYIQPLDQMARISRTELGEKLDEILDKADKDNVGFVITDEGKDDLVLCPIRWMKCIYDDDFGCIVNSALRYAIGRHTYMIFCRIKKRDESAFLEALRELPNKMLLCGYPDYPAQCHDFMDKIETHRTKERTCSHGEDDAAAKVEQA